MTYPDDVVEKAQKIWLEAHGPKGIAVFAREAYQRGRNEVDHLAERRGIERAAEALMAYAQTLRYGGCAGGTLGDALAEEYRMRAPYIKGAEIVRALAPPMADAGPTEPAGASDKEGT